MTSTCDEIYSSHEMETLCEYLFGCLVTLWEGRAGASKPRHCQVSETFLCASWTSFEQVLFFFFFFFPFYCKLPSVETSVRHGHCYLFPFLKKLAASWVLLCCLLLKRQAVPLLSVPNSPARKTFPPKNRPKDTEKQALPRKQTLTTHQTTRSGLFMLFEATVIRPAQCFSSLTQCSKKRLKRPTHAGVFVTSR